MKLPIKTYVRVYEGNREWYGVITGHLNDGSYQIKVGGTDRQVTVPRHQVSLHPMFVAYGHVRDECFALKIAVSDQDARYHITAASNLDAIKLQGGLVPKKRASGGFAGLDAARGANTLENIPKRIKDILEAQALSPDYAALFDKKHADALLGSKEEFVYATRNPRTVCFYAYDIADKTKKTIDLKHLVVFTFTGKGHTWYQDHEDDDAEKTLTMIPLKEMRAACFKKGKLVPDESPGTTDARNHLNTLPWIDCGQNGWMGEILKQLMLAAQ
jgi:hypothetical protein